MHNEHLCSIGIVDIKYYLIYLLLFWKGVALPCKCTFWLILFYDIYNFKASYVCYVLCQGELWLCSNRALLSLQCYIQFIITRFRRSCYSDSILVIAIKCWIKVAQHLAFFWVYCHCSFVTLFILKHGLFGYVIKQFLK